MATPRVESIALDIVAALDAITTGNSFEQTLSAVRRARIDWQDETPENGKVLVSQEDDETDTETQNIATDLTQRFELGALVLKSKNDATELDTLRNKVKCDIWKKLMTDRTRGGYAFNTIITGATNLEEGDLVGITVHVEVKYRISTTNPYAKG